MTSAPVSSRKQTSAPVEAKPHRWALSFWARGFRRLARRWLVTRHVRRFCSPLELEGLGHFSLLKTPALIIANHSSHFDTLIVLSTLPGRLYDRTAVAAAADRFYRRKLQGLRFSLTYNAYPISRGGGSAALAYSEWLMQRGWSLLIFPEGTRAKGGQPPPFHPGPAILALRQRVPVLPIYIEGACNILPPGTRRSRPAAVTVRVGVPLSFDAGTPVAEATAAMEAAMRALAGAEARPAQARAS